MKEEVIHHSACHRQTGPPEFPFLGFCDGISPRFFCGTFAAFPNVRSNWWNRKMQWSADWDSCYKLRAAKRTHWYIGTAQTHSHTTPSCKFVSNTSASDIFVCKCMCSDKNLWSSGDSGDPFGDSISSCSRTDLDIIKTQPWRAKAPYWKCQTCWLCKQMYRCYPMLMSPSPTGETFPCPEHS